MSMLHSCPRCTQALPASAKFCRRCGAAVGEMATPAVPYAPTKPRSLLTAGLSALVAVALVVAGLTYWDEDSTPMAAPAVPSVSPYQPVSPSGSVYINDSPPVVVVDPDRRTDPGFRFDAPAARDGAGDRSRDHHGAGHEQGR